MIANFKNYMSHEEIDKLHHAVKVDNKVGTLQGLTRDKISDSLVARVNCCKDSEISLKCSSDDDLDSQRIIVSGPEREYIGRTCLDITIGEDDDFKYGKVVELVKRNSFNSIHFQYYNQ